MSGFKISYLNHDRKYFYQINQTDQQNKQRHLHHICSTCHKSAQCQRTGISHKHFCWIYIKQKESHQSTDNGSCHRFDPALCSNGNYGKKYRYDQSHAGSQSIQAICKVHTVYSTDHSKKQHRNRKPSKVQIMIRPEWDTHCKINICIVQDIKNKNTGHNDLQSKFLPCQQSV